MARHARHPYAALLFADFILSREAQELIEKRDRVPSSNAIRSAFDNFEYELIYPDSGNR